ncbi:MAG: PEP-CTERM sorting domain-containing protein [Phycisphaerales bacterium]|nr:PEP-CTERM sorting domain-containing protein [Phycisphaerales bacterium]
MPMKIVIILASCAGFASVTLAGGVNIISDANSTATFNTGSGQIDWTVDGVSQLFTQEFYFRRASDTREYRVDTNNLTLDGIFMSDTNPFSDTSNDAIAQLYSDGNGLQIETIFTIRGGTAGSSAADIAETIIIRNNSASTMNISFFQFVDFDLGGDALDDNGQIVGGNTAMQNDNDTFISETVATPAPSFFQMGNAATMANMFNDGLIDNLNNNPSDSGDVAWAFQWDITLAAGQQYIITKDKSIVPAPGSIMLLGAAGLIAGRRRRN